MLLSWTGPYDLISATDGKGEDTFPDDTGVYLWVMQHGGQRRIHYVGYAGNSSQLQYSHIIYALGGGYPIPKLPINEAIEWQRPANGIRGSWGIAYHRLAEHIGASPASFEQALTYLRSIEVLVCKTSA